MTDQTPTFELPPLPYGHADLAPVLSEETLQVHHGKHHARYVTVLNGFIADKGLTATSIEQVTKDAHAKGDKPVFNNAAQAWNHAFFWESMSPKATAPAGALLDAINAAFGSLEELKKRFVAEGVGHFGSGWAWLIVRGGKLEVVSTHDAGLPILEDGVTALLACDVWEHAYYIDYRQDRPTWLGNWFDKLANWDFAARQFAAATEGGEGWRYPAPK